MPAKQVLARAIGRINDLSTPDLLKVLIILQIGTVDVSHVPTRNLLKSIFGDDGGVNSALDALATQTRSRFQVLGMRGVSIVDIGEARK